MNKDDPTLHHLGGAEMKLTLRLYQRLRELLVQELCLHESVLDTLSKCSSLQVVVLPNHVAVRTELPFGPEVTYEWTDDQLRSMQLARDESEQLEHAQCEFSLQPNSGFTPQSHDKPHQPNWAQEAPPAYSKSGAPYESFQKLMNQVRSYAGEETAQLVDKFASRVEDPQAFYQIDRYLEKTIKELSPKSTIEVGYVRYVEQVHQHIVACTARPATVELADLFSDWVLPQLNAESKPYHHILMRVSFFLLSLARGDLPGQIPLTSSPEASERAEIQRLWSAFFTQEGNGHNTEFDYFLREALRQVNLTERVQIFNRLKNVGAEGQLLLQFLQRCCQVAGVKFALVLRYLTDTGKEFQDARDTFWGMYPLGDAAEAETLKALDELLASAHLPGFRKLAEAWIGEGVSKEVRLLLLENLAMVVNGLLDGAFPRQNVALLTAPRQLPTGYLETERAHLNGVLDPERLFEPEQLAPGLNQSAMPLPK